jgi:hypothetical protein
LELRRLDNEVSSPEGQQESWQESLDDWMELTPDQLLTCEEDWLRSELLLTHAMSPSDSPVAEVDESPWPQPSTELDWNELIDPWETLDQPDVPAEIQGARLLNEFELEEVGRQLIDLLDPEAWAEADIAQRMVMAQRAHAFIREAYGLRASPLLYDLNLPPKVAGSFDSDKGQVSLNAALLEDAHPGELLDALAHENRHDVQVELVKQLRSASDRGLAPPVRDDVDWSDVDNWATAWGQYDTNDATAYFANELEVDARRAGLQLAGNGYWRGYMNRLAEGEEL